jgi:hypothetical protein
MNVFIEGDRSLFLSKTAVERFKSDIRVNSSDNFDSVDSTKYLKEGYTFNITKKENDITAKICNISELQIENKHKELRQRLRNAQRCRGGEQYKQLDSLKRTVPDKIFKSYVNLIKNYGVNNIPSPLEVIENPDKFRTQISTVTGTSKQVSNDVRLSNAIKQYFASLGKFLCIEPANLSFETEPDIVFDNVPKQQKQQMQQVEKIKTSNDDTDTEDDDEAPKLV